MREIYLIGGSTCCGKSSMAELLRERYKLRYYKLDNYIDLFTERMAKAGDELCRQVNAFSMEEMWMRDPEQLCEEELTIYRNMFPMAMKAIAGLKGKEPVIAEGAGFLPELVHEAGIDAAHYVCCVPTRTFQYNHYSQRSWVKHYLKGCSDPEKAFDNWMERDALFAHRVLGDARQLGYESLVVDGVRSIEDNADAIAEIFGFKQPSPKPDDPGLSL